MNVNLDTIFAAAAKSLFYIPVIREMVITLGGRIASPEVLAGMKTFGLAPGGGKCFLKSCHFVTLG